MTAVIFFEVLALGMIAVTTGVSAAADRGVGPHLTFESIGVSAAAVRGVGPIITVEFNDSLA